MQSSPEDVVRLQPTSDSLNVILKNTNFRDNMLAVNSKIQLRIDYTANIPVLIFKFQEHFYDFLTVLNHALLSGSNQQWLNKNPVVIRLVLSDSVITDRLSIRSFLLDPLESDELRAHLKALEKSQLSRILEMEEYIYGNVNTYLG